MQNSMYIVRMFVVCTVLVPQKEKGCYDDRRISVLVR